VALAARRHAIMSRALAAGALQISPPLVIEQDELEELVAGLKAALDDVEAAR
jgi:adenosylmethionine-8-amino-7-oxononanoate aminotransferase